MTKCLQAQAAAWGGHEEIQLYAARGYAVLHPSIPMPTEIKDGGTAADPYLELTKGVLPALDEAIEEGVADPNRIAVMGHSFGGYTTYGVVSQTNRFKAAISRAGPANLVSSYGTFQPGRRYRPQLPIYGAAWAAVESAQGTTGSPPWKDPRRYLRNSPIFYADRIETPMLIVEGDLDSVPIQQGEEFFTALARQNKRARFLSYAGEGHVVGSPANMGDMVYQILSWLDERLDVARDAHGNLLWDNDQVDHGRVHRPSELRISCASTNDPRAVPGNHS